LKLCFFALESEGTFGVLFIDITTVSKFSRAKSHKFFYSLNTSRISKKTLIYTCDNIFQK
jgi:hypothetical protein